MKRTKSTLLALSIAIIAVLVSAQGVLGVETSLTDYSRAVMLDNPTYYWTFNEAGTTDAANEVMRWETESQMLPVLDATRVSSYSSALGNAASFNDNASFWAEMIDRGNMPGAYAIEYWVKAPANSGAGYLANFLGYADLENGITPGGDSPGVIHGFSPNQTELWYGGPRTGAQAKLNFSDGQWHHVVMAVNADAAGNANATNATLDRVDIAVDGVVTTSLTDVQSRLLTIRGAINIGACKPVTASGSNDYAAGPEAGGVWDGFTGQVDEFAVYDLSGLDATAYDAKLNNLAGHYGLASTPTAITPFKAVAANEVSYSVISGDPINSTYNDATGSELSDDIYCGAISLDNSVGFSGDDTYTELEFDLGEAKSLESIWINYLGPGGKWGIHAPESVELSFSTDGTNFSNAVTFDDFNDTSDDPYNSDTGTGLTYWNERLAQVDVSVEAQYVRANFTHDGTFIFLSEFDFMEAVEEESWIAGDANKDGKVDGSDVTILANNWQAGVNSGDGAATWEMGDFNNDGKVDGSDVTILANNWQSGVDSVASAVPEPGTLVLLISAIASLLFWRRVR